MVMVSEHNVNEKGHLLIGGIDSLELTKTYGTPLFVYDLSLIRSRARAFLATFQEENIGAQVAYASKAFSCIAMYQVIEQEGLSLDVVSAGELYTAIQAGYPPERIHFHGNNKSVDELMLAMEHKIGCIVVDNFYEIELLKSLTTKLNQKVKILLRVTPGVEAHTHDYITTGQQDSKFGFDLMNGQADQAFQQVYKEEFIELLGLHCHIGSQIFETVGFKLAAEKLITKMIEWDNAFGYACKVLNLGGGFGIKYTEQDTPLEPSTYVKEMISAVKQLVANANLEMPEIWIEPGRSLVGDSGTSLYTIGSEKEVPEIRNYLAVDGGMSDNIRPALYGAEYDAAIANKMGTPKKVDYTIAGKCCESGDKLIEHISLPKAEPGDILAVFCTGAYGYSMASNYNRMAKPAVVFVENGQHQLAVKRETLEDLIRLDLPYHIEKGRD
ncbi:MULTISPECIES: diaminopimelate decarboxylase [unclassified Psychrobacillus]|uniref:diaminopimelate decarboxylase n=1 Tax=unclassified Psychrobacillus TaxID=2636677 RepID=UPI00146A9B47|nr:diaminopimelate decarboxylase [Psychrobacillus sp. BL-248-WT-3]NME07610.1 diaminopimelate decarboxylase [Psychrobacillus sp. BL-248-WT-3]